jgi:hypothetical protein
MSRLRGQQLLNQVFFARLVETPLLRYGQPQTHAILALGSLAGAAALLPLVNGRKYLSLRGGAGAFADSLAEDRLIALSVCVLLTGLVALLVVEGICPDRRDAVVLGTLPVSSRRLVVSRVGALWRFAGLFWAATAGVTSVSLAFVGSVFGENGGFARNVLGFALGTGLAQASVFFGIVGLYCLLVSHLSGAVVDRVSAFAQLVVLFLLCQRLARPALLHNGQSSLLLEPFVAVHRYIVGTGGHLGLAAATVCATGLVVSVAIGLYVISYRRLTRIALAADDRARRERFWLDIVFVRPAAGMTRGFVSRAIQAFVIWTILRNRRHRMLFLCCLGGALAIAWPAVLVGPLLGNAGPSPEEVTVLAAPLIVISLLLASMRVLFAVPANLNANWIFRLMGPGCTEAIASGAIVAMVFCAVLPVSLLSLVVGVALWSAPSAVVHAVVCLLLGILLAEGLLLGFDRVPFTYPAIPNVRRAWVLAPAYFVIFSACTYTLAHLELMVLARPVGLLPGILLLAGLIFTVARARRRGNAMTPTLRFDPSEPDEVAEGVRLRESVGG